jgi:aldehyde dehydrogenase (NAD+)
VAANPAVQALSFTGSHTVGSALYQALAPRMIRTQLEMGSKNATIVLADADLDLAARLSAIAGFGLTGQACTATSRVIVERSVLAAFTEKFVALAKAWKVGPGLSAGVQMGPAVNEAELRGNLDAIVQAKSEGAELVWGGERLAEGDLAHGWFMQPAVLGGVKPSMRVAQEEIFGPVVAVMAVDSFDEAIAVANGVKYGLSATVVTRDFKKALQYTDRIEVGVVKVNQISTGLALQAPFGGVKQSSTDTFREQGTAGLEFYSRTKTVYLDYSA